MLTWTRPLDETRFAGSVLTKPDIKLVKQLLDDMPLGELHYREMLG